MNIFILGEVHSGNCVRFTHSEESQQQLDALAIQPKEEEEEVYCLPVGGLSVVYTPSFRWRSYGVDVDPYAVA